MKTLKIVSRFYVIYGNGVPIYVGYTNRTIKQRFREHQKDKDFSDYESVDVAELKDKKLTYEFTWDYEETCRHAQLVSDREASLVKQYRTQDSVYQRAIGGGQTWANVKGFIRVNKDNPKYVGMTSAELKHYLDVHKRLRVDLGHFVSNMNPQRVVDLGHFVSHMNPQKVIDLGHFVSDMNPQKVVDLHNFVGRMNPQKVVDLHNFVNNMNIKNTKDN